MTDEARLRQLLDREDVTLVSRKYAVGIDTRNWQLYRSVFLDEVDLDFTSFAGGSPSRMKADDWVAVVRDTISGFQATQHLIVPYVIDFDGPDRATSLAYMYAQHFLPNDSGDSFLWLGGHYTNRVVRHDGAWKFASVTLTVSWTVGNRHVFQLASERWATRQKKGD